MKKRKYLKLSKSLGSRYMLWLLEYKKNLQDVESYLKSKRFPELFVESALQLARLREYDLVSFQNVIDSHVHRMISYKVNELTDIFIRVQNLLGGTPYFFNEKTIDPKKLASRLLRRFKGKKEVKYQFAIGSINVGIELRLNDEDNIHSVGYKISMFYSMNKERLVFFNSTSGCLASNTTSMLFLDASREFVLFDCVLEAMGENYLMKPWATSSTEKEPRTTLFGYAAKVASDTLGKELPKDFENGKSLNIMARDGKMRQLKLALKKAYKNQSKLVLPELMIVLSHKGDQYIANCKNVRMSMSPKTSLFQKLDYWMNHSITTVQVPGAVKDKQKIFILCYNDSDGDPVGVFSNILANAGFGGSWILATQNFPSVADLLLTQQIDYICQTSLGHGGWKELFLDEIMRHTEDAKHHLWKNKVIKLSLTNNDLKFLTQDYLQQKQCVVR